MLTRRQQLGLRKDDEDAKDATKRGTKRKAKAKAAPKGKGRKKGEGKGETKTDGEQEEGKEEEEEREEKKEAKPRLPTSKVIIAVKGCLDVARKDPAKWHHVETLFNAASTEVTPENLIKYKNWGLSMYWGKGRVGLLSQGKHILSFSNPYGTSISLPLKAVNLYVARFFVSAFFPQTAFGTPFILQKKSLQGQLFTTVLDCWMVISDKIAPNIVN